MRTTSFDRARTHVVSTFSLEANFLSISNRDFDCLKIATLNLNLWSCQIPAFDLFFLSNFVKRFFRSFVIRCQTICWITFVGLVEFFWTRNVDIGRRSVDFQVKKNFIHFQQLNKIVFCQKISEIDVKLFLKVTHWKELQLWMSVERFSIYICRALRQMSTQQTSCFYRRCWLQNIM